MFLIGGYQRYKVPYVWLRTNHERFKIGPGERDYPIPLSTTDDYKRNPCKVWDIVAELVAMNVVPRPANPYKIDFEFLKTLPPGEQLYNYGALAGLLMEIHSTKPGLAPLVRGDLSRCLELHFALAGPFFDGLRREDSSKAKDDLPGTPGRGVRALSSADSINTPKLGRALDDDLREALPVRK